ncbi:MAG: sensor histidine kinase [Burkholderiales bacterium]|nr:sensor histidine kinase [Burkholderiales bacterium]MDE2300086.1 sensor histidine kinase [Burkholderiales bacterium]MDE2626425.1 sensor histidine kinase [Burkholderiales bacterium]
MSTRRWASRLTLRALRRLPGLSPGTRSLQRHLLLWLLLPQLVLWLAAASFTYDLADTYANRAIDASLTTASRALARQVKPSGSGLLIDFPRAAQDIIEADPDDRVYYMVSTPPGEFILGNNQMPKAPPIGKPLLGHPYLYDARMRDPSGDRRLDKDVRVVALYLAYGEPGRPQLLLVQVARSRTRREELARQILIDTALPLSGLIVLMSVIVWGGIRGGLAPLARLRSVVESRAPNDLAPIRLEAAPEEVRSLAIALNALLNEVNKNVNAQKRFISDAAHQLRTPLAGLKSQTELALASPTVAADPDLQSRLQRVHESATRSSHLVSQLLALARAEPEAAMAHTRTRFDLRALAREVAAEQVPRALAAGIDLGSEDSAADAPPLQVQGNAMLIREALVNLVDNAIRYAGRGASITVDAKADGADAVVSVEDTGPGVPETDHERIFQRFARATHEGNGCGLGLAIVKEIVERSHGRVHLQSVQPHGLRAEVRLPVVA